MNGVYPSFNLCTKVQPLKAIIVGNYHYEVRNRYEAAGASYEHWI